MSRESAMAALTGTSASTPPPPQENSPPLSSVPAGESAQAPEGLKSTPFSHLAKKEAEIVRQRDILKKDRETIEAEKEKIRGIQKQYDDYVNLKTKDPIGALKQLGFSETDIMNYLANQQPEELSHEQKAAKAAQEAAQTEIKAFQDAQAKAAKDAQEATDKRLIGEFRGSLAKTIESNPDKYEYCKFNGPAAEELAYETVLAVVADSKGEDVPTPEEAIQMVEAFYEEQDKLMNTIKKRNPTPAAQPQTSSKTPERTRTVTPGFPQTEQPKPTITKSRTLHNGTTSTIASTRQHRNETAEQKRERLIERLRNGS